MGISAVLAGHDFYATLPLAPPVLFGAKFSPLPLVGSSAPHRDAKIKESSIFRASKMAICAHFLWREPQGVAEGTPHTTTIEERSEYTNPEGGSPVSRGVSEIVPRNNITSMLREVVDSILIKPDELLYSRLRQAHLSTRPKNLPGFCSLNDCFEQSRSGSF